MKSFRKFTVKFISLFAATVLFATVPFAYPAGADEQEIGEGLREIGRGLRENIDEDAFAFRTSERRGLRRTSGSELPEACDLRDRNVVTPVRLQNPFGTCWGFAAIASAETNILSHGLTTKTANDLDLSEKHLAFFARRPILSDVSNPKYLTQEGEGTIFKGEKPSSEIYGEGFSFVATSLFAAGIGPVEESDNPLFVYRGKNGNRFSTGGVDRWYSEEDDWWIDDDTKYDYRWEQDYVLKESNILPLPSAALEKGNTADWERANKAIKEMIYDGNAVQVGFYADTSTPGQEAQTEYISPEWAHYTFEKKEGNHAVTIVGWDDNYPKERFRHLKKDGTQAPIPENNGAWLVKNSWGAETNEFPNNGYLGWGLLEGQDKISSDYKPVSGAKHTGYFWLSYEDRSIDGLEALEFDRAATQPYYLAQYDLMPVNDVDFTAQPFRVSMANVFDVNDILDERETAAKLEEVSCQTASPETTVTYDVYLMESGARNPDDGTRIAHFVKTYKYGGFHKESLPEPKIVGRGDKFSVVVTQLTPDGEYGFNLQLGLNKTGTSAAKMFYSNGVINAGESYVYNSTDGKWDDLADETLRKALLGPYYSTLAMDNFPIKSYLSKANAPEVVITPPEAVTGLEYDGSAHALVTAGSVKQGETEGMMYYAVENETGYPGDYSTSVPEKTTSGSYRVYYKAVVNGKVVGLGDVETAIAPKELTFEWSDFTSTKYDGDPHGVSVTLSGKCGSDDVNPVVENASQTNAGSYTASLTGLSGAKKDNYTLPSSGRTKNYSITKRNVTLTSATDSKEYDGSALTNSRVTASEDGFVGSEGVNVDVTGSQTAPGTSRNMFSYTPMSNTREGNYNITCEYGTLTVNWWGDDKRNLHPVTIVANSDTVTYDGYEHTVSGFTDESVRFTLGGETYRVSGVTAEASGTDIGSYTSVVRGTPVITGPGGAEVTSHFAVGTENGTLRIRTRSVNDASITLENDLIYNGSELTQNISVRVDGRTLTKDTDYEISGNKATSAGTHTLTIIGKGNYEGSASKDYEIKYPEITGVSVSQSGTLDYNGYSQVPSVRTECDQNGVTFTFAKSSDSTYTSGIPSYRDAGEYTVYYRAEKQDYRSKTGTFTVRIEKATLGVSWGSTSFTYDGSTHVPKATATRVLGEDNIRFTVSGGTSQEGSHTATITGMEGSGCDNYNLPSDRSVSFKITKSSGSSGSSLGSSNGSSNSTGNNNTTTKSTTSNSKSGSGNSKPTTGNNGSNSTGSNNTTKNTNTTKTTKTDAPKTGSDTTKDTDNKDSKETTETKDSKDSDSKKTTSASGTAEKIAKNTTLADNEEALKAILGEEKFKELADAGKTPSVRLGVKGMAKNDVPENDRKIAEKKTEELKSSIPNLTVGAYLDLTLEMKEDSDWEKVSNTKGPVKIVVKVPSDIQKKAAKCFMMRIHDEEVTVLEDTDEDPETLTVESDEFSTYVMLYQEKEKQAKEEKVSTASADTDDKKNETKIEEKSPDTGTASITEHSSEPSGEDNEIWRIVLFVVLVVVVVGVILLGVYGSKILNKE